MLNIPTNAPALENVGNVTITDGVATGFAANKYLQSPVALDFTQQDYEISCLFKCTNVSGANTVFRTVGAGIVVYINSSGAIDMYIKTSTASSSQQFNYPSQVYNNQTYSISFRRKNGSYSLYLNGNLLANLNLTGDIQSNSNGICFGGGNPDQSSQYMQGSIYLKGTVISLNGSLIAGELSGVPEKIIIDDGANQTEANYLIVDNKLVWANPQIYLQNNPNWNAYINTGIVPTNDMRFDVIAQITDTSTTWDGTVFGERNANNAAQTGLLLWHNTNASGWGSFCYGRGWEGNWNNLTPSIKGTKNRFKYDGSTLTVNGQAPTTGNWISKSSFSTTYPIFLFGFNNTGTLENRRFHGRIYNATFWSGSTKLAEFVPVPAGMTIGSYTVPSNGMWDIVSQTFYGNSGSGDFEISGFAQDYIIQNGNIVYVNSNIYLESSGTQYINTGVSATFDTLGLDFMFMRTATGTSSQEEGLFGGKSAGDNQAATIYNPNTEKYTLNCWCGNGTAAAITNSFANNVKYSLQLNFNGSSGRTWTFNGTTGSTTKSNTARSNASTFTIFADGTTPYAYFRGRFYSAKITRNGVLERHLVPVPQGLVIGTYTTPSVGMWDIVNKQFYANAGSGTFTWGKDQ